MCSLQKMKKTHLLLEAEHTADILDCDNFVEAIVLGQYNYNEFKSIEDAKKPVNIAEICIHVAESIDLTLAQAKIDLAQTKCESANWARDLANKPGNALTPSILAEQALTMAKETGSEAYVLDEAQMQELGKNSLLAVSAAFIIFVDRYSVSSSNHVSVILLGISSNFVLDSISL